MNQYRCETCKHKQVIETGEGHVGHPWFFCKDEKIPYDGRAFTKYRGCASHSDFQSRDAVLKLLEDLDMAFHKYEMDVADYDFPAPLSHTTLMQRLDEMIEELRQGAGEH
jgi:hypothetical protein